MRARQLVVAGIVALGAAVVCPNGAHAQAAAASPFHAGQWGIEAYAAGQTGGVMRFFTPRTALVLNLSAMRLQTNSDEPASTLVSSTGTQFDATLGFRRHTPLATRVVGTVGAGVVGGTIQQRQEYRGAPSPSTFHSSNFGAYAEFGGQYMVADHFAVGVAYRFLARHVKNSGTGQAGAELFSSILPVRATLYF